MTVTFHRMLALFSVLLMAWGAMACDKSAAACDSTSQCETGFTCSASGLCESVDASVDPSDAAPACPETTHTCAGAVPTGWSGPVAGTRAGIGETLADCSGEYASEAALVGEALIEQGACTCSCSGNAENVLCGSASVAERPSGGCFMCPIVGTTCNSQEITSENTCQSVPGNLGDLALLRVSLGSVTDSGDCSSLPSVSNDLTSFFASEERYCSAAAIDGTCAEAGPCVPKVSDSAFTAMCIFQGGDHECPEAYPAKETRFQAIEDGRSCSACTCVGPAVGSSCGGAVHIGPSCASSFVVNTTSCLTNPVETGGGTTARYAPNPITDCAAEGGVEIGEIAATGQTTFCCAEAIPDPVLN